MYQTYWKNDFLLIAFKFKFLTIIILGQILLSKTTWFGRKLILSKLLNIYALFLFERQDNCPAKFLNLHAEKKVCIFMPHKILFRGPFLPFQKYSPHIFDEIIYVIKN